MLHKTKSQRIWSPNQKLAGFSSVLGELAERLKALVSKTCAVLTIPPSVRIGHSPLFKNCPAGADNTERGMVANPRLLTSQST